MRSTIAVMQKFIDEDILSALMSFMTKTIDFIDKYGKAIALAVIRIAEVITPGAMGYEGAAKGAAKALSSGETWTLPFRTIAGLLGLHFATGGYVPATPGGVPAIIGEGGEGEYVIPESKMNGLGGVTIVFSGNVYGMNDFKQQVRSIMNEYTTKANFR